MNSKLCIFGIFTIFLVVSLNFVPAVNNSSSIVNNFTTNSSAVNLDNSLKNITNNTTNTNKTVTINYPTFNYLDYYTPITNIPNPLDPHTWRVDFVNKKNGLQML